jgi:hypothetical protein
METDIFTGMISEVSENITRLLWMPIKGKASNQTAPHQANQRNEYLKGTSKNSDFVIPAKAGIQYFNRLDTGLRRCDEFLEVS